MSRESSKNYGYMSQAGAPRISQALIIAEQLRQPTDYFTTLL